MNGFQTTKSTIRPNSASPFAILGQPSHLLPWLLLGLFTIFGLVPPAPVIADTGRGSPVGTSSCIQAGWPSDRSTLLPDTALRRGVLDNGFRYVLRANSEPKNRVAIYLYVPAGSLHEKDNQRGIAHYLEHMMFNGSTHFPPGSLIDYFQRIGMAFGADTNAFTSYDQTVYHIILPDGSPGELEAGFQVVADFARGALLLEEEIDRERGVIFAEKRARDSAAYRTHVASTAFAFRGTRLPERVVIGVDETLAAADRQTLEAFYDGWYRPEHMVLVVVGDMDPVLTEELIRDRFAGLSGDGEPSACFDFGKLAHQGDASFFHYEPELGKTNVSIETFWDITPESDSLGLQMRELYRNLAAMIIGYRLQRLEEEGNKPFRDATYHYGDLVGRLGYGSIAVRTDPEGWQTSLAMLEQTLRQALAFGFTEGELDRARKEVMAYLESRLATAETENSRKIARAIIRQFHSDRVFQSPAQEMELYAPRIAKIELAQVNAAFHEVWNGKNRLISVTGTTQLGRQAEEIIAEVYRQSQTEQISALDTMVEGVFPYLPIGKTVVSPPLRQEYPAIGVERLVYSNGLVINLKHTDFNKESFQLTANFGRGEQSEPRPGMKMLAEDITNSSGSGRLPASALNELTAGSSIDLRFQINETSFAWSGGGLSRDFPLFVQILHTLLLDPGFRPNLFATAHARIAQLYQQLEQEIEGAVPLMVQPFLANYTRHFGYPPWEDVARVTFTELAEWAKKFAGPEDLEISLVGDFDRQAVVDILGRHFGGLHLQPPRGLIGERIDFPADRLLEVGVATSMEKSLLAVAWPTDDFWDINRTRRLHLLAAVMEDRLRKVIRERLGATYSVQAASFGSRLHPGFGYLVTQMTVEPGSEEAIFAEIFTVNKQLLAEGVTEEELARAKAPLLTSLRDNVKNNQYWLNSVLTLSSRHPQQLVWPENILSDFAAVEADELTRLARKYLADGRAAMAKVVPKEASR